jgi:primosomal protein N''
MFIADPGNKFFLSNYLKTVNTNLADVQIVQMNSNDLQANFLHNRLQVVLTWAGEYSPCLDKLL